MYLSKSGLSILVVGGMLFIVTASLFVVGEQDAIPSVWLAVAFVFGAAAVVWVVRNLVRRVDSATLENVPREYMTVRRKYFQGYWALKFVSTFVKIVSVITFIGSLFNWILFSLGITARLTNVSTFGGGVVQTVSVFTLVASLIIPILISCVFAYASAQLIDVILSMESSLKSLADRRRQNNPPSSN